MGYKMRKIVFTKIVLIIFLGSFQNILSQNIKELEEKKRWWESLTLHGYIENKDRSKIYG